MEYCSTTDHPRYDLSKLPTYTYELLWNIFHCIDQLHTILNILANFRRVMNIATNHMNTLLFEKSSSLFQVSKTQKLQKFRKSFRIFFETILYAHHFYSAPLPQAFSRDKSYYRYCRSNSWRPCQIFLCISFS